MLHSLALRWFPALPVAAFLLLPSTAAGAEAALPVFTDVRLGDHADSTRLVLDLDGGSARFTWQLSDDGERLTVLLQARTEKPLLPRRSLGLVRTVASAAADQGTEITVMTARPVSVTGTGTLAPNASYRHHRIYFDLTGASPVVATTVALTTPPPPPPPTVFLPPPTAPAPEPEQAAVTSVEPVHPWEHKNPLVYSAADKAEAHAGDAHDAEAEEPAATLKVGAAAEHSVTDHSNRAGPTVAVQTGILHDALEVEAGTAALFDHGQPEWTSGLLLKKPFELTRHLDFELGAGPTWIHRPADGDAPQDSVGAEAIAEMVYWPWASKSFGWYLESGYGYDFGRIHDQAVGLRLGIVVAVP